MEQRSEQAHHLESTREAVLNNLKARHANTNDPYVREKQQVVADFADHSNPTTFEEAWLRLDEIEQRESEEG